MSAKTKPSDFLKNIIGRPVLVKLNSGVDYRGAYFEADPVCGAIPVKFASSSAVR